MRRLFVYAPSILRGTGEWNSLVERLQEEVECSADEFKCWPATKGEGVGRLTRGGLQSYAQDLAAQIDEWDQAEDGQPYDQIVMVGNSIGALLVRWAWLYGAGAFPRVSPRPWAGKVGRIVLVAGLNRGLDTRADRRWKTLVRKVAVSLAAPFRFAWKDALAGAPFVTDLRLRWMRFYATNPKRAPEVVQLLGTRDDLVHREDSRDIEQFPRAAHVPVAGATHNNILALKGPEADNRYKLFRKYLIEPLDYTDPLPTTEQDVRDIAFVVHGIRAGIWGWVPKMREHLTGDGWLVITPTYRFFSAMAFSVPMMRRRKARWFLDQYSRAFARHPTASFHFVGHSNGTYLLGRALKDVQAVRFDRAYLAGSVLPADYSWADRLADEQVQLVRSDRGYRDLPVALLSTGLGGLGMDDVGGGGFEGFSDLNEPRAIQWGYFPGGHGAPLADDARLKNVAEFVRTGRAPEPDSLIRDGGGWLAVLSRAAPLLLFIVLVIVIAVVVAAVVVPSPFTLFAAGSVLLAMLLLAVT